MISAAKKAIIKALDVLGGFRALQWYNRNRPLILMYHRITDEPYCAGLAPAEFEKHLAFVTRYFRVVPIKQLLQEVATNQVKPYTLALTFDDGHADFFQHAWPLLQKYQLPASLYITTGFVDGACWLWPDLLKYIIMHNRKDFIAIPGSGNLITTKDFILKNWHRLGDYCLTLDTEERNQFLANLAQQCDVAIPASPVQPFAGVTWDQLRSMRDQGLEVGSHTVTHPILSKLDYPLIEQELAQSAARIKEQLNQMPTGLCYPNGRPIDITPQVVECARRLGYEYGLLARNISIEARDLFHIGRLAANDNFDYFRWTLSYRQKPRDHSYIN
jgi:peptidoglycan/xylan/chitin deacetylase (PgdA/CDA1 family)